MSLGAVKRTSRLAAIVIALLVACPLSGATTARTILVFPFENQSNRADLSWLSEGFAVFLSLRLAAPDRYVLGREERDAAYAQLELGTATPLTLASDYKVAEVLGVDWAVVGSFAVAGDHLTAQARLLDARGLKLSDPIEVTGVLNDLVELQTRLAWRLLAAHDPQFTVGTEDDFRLHFPEVRLDAFESYIRGILATDDASRVRYLTEADRRDPRDHHPAFQLGRYYFDQKDYAKAVLWLRKMDDRDPNYLESLFLTGVGEYFLGRDGASEKDFADLAKQIPLNEVSNNLGVLEARRHDYAEALANFERAYNGDPTVPEFAFNMGVCLWYLKRYGDSIKYLQEAVSIDGDDPGAHTLLGLELGKVGDLEGQRREGKWLAEHESGSSNNVAEQDLVLQTRITKHYDGRAFRLLALAVRNAEEQSMEGMSAAEHGQFHLARGRQLLAAGRLSEAERDLAEAVSLLPLDDEAHVAMAQVLDAEGKRREAAAELEYSLKLKDSVTAHLMLARVYLSLNRVDAARDQDQAALSLDPGNREAAQLLDQIRSHAPGLRRTP
ncbi:MAG: tetratricopeptide repeat protein [Terriglobia bacterium]